MTIYHFCCSVAKHGDPCKLNHCSAGVCVTTVIENVMDFQCNCPEDRTGRLCEGRSLTKLHILTDFFPFKMCFWSSHYQLQYIPINYLFLIDHYKECFCRINKYVEPNRYILYFRHTFLCMT